MNPDAAIGAEQMGAEPFARGTFDHTGAKRDEAERVVSAMPVRAAEPVIEPPKGQFAARVIRPGDAQPVHPVAPVADHQCPDRRSVVTRQHHHMTIEHMVRMVRNHDLMGVCTGNPRDW